VSENAHEPVRRGLIRRYFDFIGRQTLRTADTIKSVGAFALITIGVTFTKFNESTHVIRPLIRGQIARAGIGMLPAVMFLGGSLGLVIIGQMVSLLTKVGAQQYIGLVMDTVVFPQGEIEALEALGIDPVHYLVVPRVIGLGLSIFALTIYLILVVMLSGLLFAFLTDVQITPGEYFGQIAAGLTYQDFVFVALKTILFGAIIAVVTCYHGLAQPIKLEQVPYAATRAVSLSVGGCLLLDVFFIFLYIIVGL